MNDANDATGLQQEEKSATPRSGGDWTAEDFDSNALLAKVKQLATPLFVECLSEETIRIRNRLLIVSILLVISVSRFAVVDVSNKEFIGGLAVSCKSPATCTGYVPAALIVVVLYFLTLFGMRASIEWHAWRVGQQEGIFGLTQLASEQQAVVQQLTDANIRQRGELFKQYEEDVRYPDALVEKRSRLSGLIARLREEVAAQVDMHVIEATSDEIELLKDEIDRDWTNWTAFADERYERHERDVAKLMKSSTIDRRVAAILYIKDVFTPAKRAIAARAWLEIWVPSPFALAAMSLGIVRMTARV